MERVLVSIWILIIIILMVKTFYKILEVIYEKRYSTGVTCLLVLSFGASLATILIQIGKTIGG